MGWIAYEWNRLHEALGEVFGCVLSKDARDDFTIRPAFAAWHALTNERAQRDMLAAAIKSRSVVLMISKPPLAEIDWVLEKLNKLAGRRNDAIHAPLAFVNQVGPDELGVEILPLYFFGNQRAASLRGKALLEEFRWCRDHLERLADYSECLIFAMKFVGQYTLPEKPELPDRARFRASKRRKAGGK